jgi:4-diphosphocytidyl-2-C-methyl-D-erythritol kinase
MPAFSWDARDLNRLLKNDLEEPVVKEYPILEWVKGRLLDVGAQASLMSGSGSTVYGLFSKKRRAEEAHDQLKNDFDKKDWEVFIARSIGH